MDFHARSQSPFRASGSRLLLSATVGTWVLAGLLSLWFYFSPYGNLSGLEWLGSPLLGLPLLAMLTTAYYFVARNKPIRPTVHAVAWSSFVFVITTANMLTLARFVFGSWKGFQALAIVITFELIPIALAVHFSLKEKSRGPLFLILAWTVVLFLVDVTSMAALGMALQPGFWAIGFMVELGLAVLMGALVIAHSAHRARPGQREGLLTSTAWRLCILIGASLLVAHFFLSAQYSVWLFSYAAAAAVLAVLVAVLRIPAGERTPVGLSR
jgi:hypothetical protein